MKNLKMHLKNWFEKLDERWKALPVKKQHLYTLYFFTVYLLLTAVVLYKVAVDNGKSRTGLVISPIENPLLKKNLHSSISTDSLTSIAKNKIHERR
jgi:hypothetical protein